MSYRVLVRRQAKSDLRQAARWYEDQQTGLGRKLVDEIDAVLGQLAINPLRHQVLEREIRRAVPRRFPYGVYFRVEQSNVVVLAIVHLQRDPGTWQGRGPGRS